MKHNIFLREYPLDIGIGPYLLYGRKVSHTFLALEIDDKPIEEIHGFSFDPISQKFEDCNRNVTQVFNLLTRDLISLRKPNETTPKLKVQIIPDNPTSFESSSLVYSSDTPRRWEMCKLLSSIINENEHEYKACSGGNCHSVTASICNKVFGVDITGQVKYHTPGISKVL